MENCGQTKLVTQNMLLDIFDEQRIYGFARHYRIIRIIMTSCKLEIRAISIKQDQYYNNHRSDPKSLFRSNLKQIYQIRSNQTLKICNLIRSERILYIKLSVKCITGSTRAKAFVGPLIHLLLVIRCLHTLKFIVRLN